MWGCPGVPVVLHIPLVASGHPDAINIDTGSFCNASPFDWAVDLPEVRFARKCLMIIGGLSLSDRFRYRYPVPGSVGDKRLVIA